MESYLHSGDEVSGRERDACTAVIRHERRVGGVRYPWMRANEMGNGIGSYLHD